MGTRIEIVGDGTAKIELTKGKFAIIDEADVSRVRTRSWYAYPARTGAGNWYACTSVRKADGTYRKISLHRFLLGDPDCPIDHANGYGLDNRRSNLRECTYSQNAANMRKPPNATGFRGVRKRSDASTFISCIMVDGKSIYLGSFQSAEEAAAAYDAAATEKFGEFARLNFPDRRVA